MRRKQKSNPRRAAASRVGCEEVRFAQVDYPMPVQPRLVVRFSGGLSLLVENWTPSNPGRCAGTGRKG